MTLEQISKHIDGILVEVEVEDIGLGKRGTVEVVAIISQYLFYFYFFEGWDEIMRWIWHWFPSRSLDVVLSMFDDGNERERERERELMMTL